MVFLKLSSSLASVAYPAPRAMNMHGKRGRGTGMGIEEGRGVAAASSRVERIMVEGVRWMDWGRVEGNE